jgi:hypothetical protein
MIVKYGNNVTSFNNRFLNFQSVITQPYLQLNTIATYLRNYMSDFRNPSFYTYRLDGTGFYILDGGGDMFDQGNITQHCQQQQ